MDYKVEIDIYYRDEKNIARVCLDRYQDLHWKKIEKEVGQRRKYETQDQLLGRQFKLLNEKLNADHNAFLKWKKGTICFKQEKDYSWFILKNS